MKAAVIYARVSTEEQDTDRQLFELTEYANSVGYSISESFIEKISGKVNAKSREAYSAMLSYIKDNNINQIYCWELSRLGRTMIDVHNNVNELRTAGINIYIKKEAIDTVANDDNTKFRLNILSAVAEYERGTIRKRTISGTHNNIRKGGVGSGSIKQYGYKKEAGKLVIDEAEAAVILEIIDLYLNKDWGLGAIANHLNNNGVETRYRKLIDSNTIQYKLASKLQWTDGSVGRLLHKKLLTGFREYGKKEIQTKVQFEHLRIIDNDTFDAIQLKMQGKRKTQANAAKYENILKGKLVCGFCGGSMVMEKGKNGLSNHYKCYNKFKARTGCTDARMINIDLLNNTVYDLTKNFKVDSKTVLTKIAENTDIIQQNQNTLQAIANNVMGLENQKKQVLKSFDNGFRTEAETANRIAEIKAELEIEENKRTIAKANIAKLNDEITLLNSTKSVDLTNASIFKSHIKSLVERVEIKTLSALEIEIHNNQIAEYENDDKYVDIDVMSKRDIIFQVKILMFDNATRYIYHLNNMRNKISKIIKIEKK